jgi:hypothetical protein
LAAETPATPYAGQQSRPPEPGCHWEAFSSPEIGLRLLVENCEDPNAHYVLSTKGEWLEQHRPADDVTFGSHQIIRVLTKPVDQSIEAAIREQFIATLADHRARASCKVVPFRFTGGAVLGSGKLRFELVPTGAYARWIDRELRKGPRNFGCGDYGKGQETVYFEYHPVESRTKFLFVDYGWDEPVFDENSIEFISP